MQEKVFAYLRQWKMLPEGTSVLAGFSGGADSTALLVILQEYGRKYGIPVKAVHVNHGIRGEEALRDQKFCEDFCRERGIPLKVIHADVPACAKALGISEEEAGRTLRRRTFEELIQEGWADRAALAHHQNDQAETMLFHLMRGTGLRGLRGMKPVSLPYIRPLLCVSREEIEAWLVKEGYDWVEDHTNRELLYTRNRIRHQVLAPMERIRPGSTVRMAATAERLLELQDYLEEQQKEIRARCVREEGESLCLSLKAFAGLHPYLQKMLLQKMLILECLEKLLPDGQHGEAVHADQICALINGRRGSRIMLPGGVCAVLEYEDIRMKRGYGTEKLQEPVSIELPGTCVYMGWQFSFAVEKWEENQEIPSNCYTKWFDYDKIKHGIQLRTRRPGDYLECVQGSHKKFKDYLIDCKIPREDRDRCVLLADGSHVIWAVGLRISEGYKITKETRRVLKVQATSHGGVCDGKASY